MIKKLGTWRQISGNKYIREFQMPLWDYSVYPVEKQTKICYKLLKRHNIGKLEGEYYFQVLPYQWFLVCVEDRQIPEKRVVGYLYFTGRDRNIPPFAWANKRIRETNEATEFVNAFDYLRYKDMESAAGMALVSLREG